MLCRKDSGVFMFTFIELVNFKSFGEIRFDFKKSNTEFKKFIAIYGENGSGKSNFVSSIELLSKLMTSFIRLDKLQKLKQAFESNKDNPELLSEDLISQIINSDENSNSFKPCRMIGVTEDTKVTYGFQINGIEGHYTIAFNDNSITKEELYYLTNKQRGYLFKLSNENDIINTSFSSYLFANETYKQYVEKTIDMYWGKHTLLSLFLGELKDKNFSFVIDNISHNCIDVIDNFMNIFILCKSSRNFHTEIISGSNIDIRDFQKVQIEGKNSKKKKQLDIIGKVINEFYTQAYTDIIKVYYKQIAKSNDSNKVYTYKLFVDKIVYGQIRTIPFDLESAGTQKVLTVLRAIIEAINGQTVVYDEIDDGIHDLLMTNILLSVQDDITGQLILTTHNTLLLEDLNPKAAYVIYVDDQGNKEARCFDDYDIRIQQSNNQRKLYLNGVFGGIPFSNKIDYSCMHMVYKDTDAEG